MDFKNIPKKFRPVPFWSWNEKLNCDETERQIDLMNDAGIGGYIMHARGGLQTEYMGEEWFDNISVGVNKTKENGMLAWAYDENGWPSGFGNGAVNGLGVKYQQKYLRFEKGVGHTDTTIANVGGYHFYYEVNPFYVDLLDCNVTSEFIKSVYEPYYEKYGNNIEGFFSDEPQLSRKGYPWSLVLQKEYSVAYGESICEVLPELFFDIGDYKNTRIKYWKLVTKLFTEGCLKQIYEWCNKRNLQYTGHMLLEETFISQLTPNGSVMPCYQYFSIPGMDCLGRTKIEKLTIYQLSSVAQQFGKKQVLSESFALTGWNVSFEELKEMYEWQMVRGVNLLCTHLSAYSIRGLRKRDYPAFFSYQEPWWDKYNLFIENVSRIGMLLSEGKSVCDTLLIHPQTTVWTMYSGDDKNLQIEELNNNFNRLIDSLEKKHNEFNLGDEIIIEKYAFVEGNTFVIGEQRYNTVIVPQNTVLLPKTKILLEEFKKNGGKVYNDTSSLTDNSIIDNEEITITKRAFDDFDLYYLVNSTNNEQKVHIKKGTAFLNASSGEEEPFSNDVVINAGNSILVLDYNKPCECIVNKKIDYNEIDLSGEWEISLCDLNALTLDTCTYYFDGEVVEENAPVSSIQDKAFSLERPVKIDMEFVFSCEYIPKELYLVCETPEIFNIKINDISIDTKSNDYYFDKSFRKFDISSLVNIGENQVKIHCDYEQSDNVYQNIRNAKMFESELNKLTFDMEIENIYLVGDFSVKTDGNFKKLDRKAVRYHGDFVISCPKKRIVLNNIEQQGFPFFAGKITLKKTFEAKKGENCLLKLNQKSANVVSVAINGKNAGNILWKPYSLDISDLIVDGENLIEIELVSSLRNLLGPHHLECGEYFKVDPASFFKYDSLWCYWGRQKWNDDYCFVEFGIK